MNDRERWDAKYQGQSPPETVRPAGWLVEHRNVLPAGDALDLATGAGHGAIWLASQGWRVMALDVSPVGLALAQRFAERERVSNKITWHEADLAEVLLPAAAFDVIVCTRFLLRGEFPARIVSALRPGGVLVYETFTTRQLEQPGNHFKDARFLLEPGELPRLFASLRILDQREGVFDGAAVASLVAQK